MSYYVHDIPGRLRVKIPGLKGNAVAAEELQAHIKGTCGVDSTSVNVVTGSLIINYDPKALSSREILECLEHKGHFDSSRAMTNDQYIQSAATRVSQVMGKALLSFAMEKAFQGSSFSFLTALI